MAQQQQTVLRVKTNKPSDLVVTGTTSISLTGNTGGFVYSGGTGTPSSPYRGTYPTSPSFLTVEVNGNGTLYFDFTLYTVGVGLNYLQIFIQHAGENFARKVLTTYPLSATSYADYFKVQGGDIITFKQGGSPVTGSNYSIYVVPDVEYTKQVVDEFDTLDLYDDIPIKLNRSFAELQDISKKNSDYSVGLKLPGSKKNNRFFENFYDVDNVSLYFDVTKKVQCDVLINDESFFVGYLRLNNISVLNTKVEYDVTLFSTVSDLYGQIGNKLMKDLNFRDPDYFYNHVFTRDNTLYGWRYESLKSSNVIPSTWFYPVAHNGYVYVNTGNTLTVQTGTTTGTSIYTTTKLGSWSNAAAAYAAGSQRGHINSVEDGIRDNQLKPALNVYGLLQLIFRESGYTIKSDFLNTPWIKLLYMYGYFSDNSPKLSFTAPPLSTFGPTGVDVTYTQTGTTNITMYVVKAGTGTPALCDTNITGTLTVRQNALNFFIPITFTIPANTPEFAINWSAGYSLFNLTTSVGVINKPLNFLPSQTGTTVDMVDGEYLDMSLAINPDIKQIDFLSSIAKKFNLVFIPSKENPKEIIVEPYEYYVGKGNVYDWTDKLSWDKGFTVQPAQNFVESELYLSDKEDGDSGNKEFKDTNNRIYGRNIVYNPTQFKSSQKKIETIFSPQLIRKWNPSTLTGVTNDVGIPLMINYAEASQENDNVVDWTYTGVKTNPRLIFNMGNFSPFLDRPREVLTFTGVTSAYYKIENNIGTDPQGSLVNPMVSHTMPLGNPDSNKINNDSLSILFNCEPQLDIQGRSVQLLGSGSTLNIYTENNVYNRFYFNRVENAYNKNTRMLSGFFQLDINDVKNLEADDLIKVNDQFFTWNKIEEYNVTNPELTKAELVQFNNRVSNYPNRYFNYRYCSGDTRTFRFKTDFTESQSILGTYYYWSIFYDYMVGALGGNVSGFTSSVPFTGNTYVPYSMWEVDEASYNISGTTHIADPINNYFIGSVEEAPEGSIYNQRSPIFLLNSGQTQATLNVFTGCTDFNTQASAIGARVFGAPSSSPYTTGITINVTDTGYIKYTTASGQQYQYIGTLGNYDIPACASCTSVMVGIPFADLASFTIVDCGSTC
jgi:hypothetical protein